MADETRVFFESPWIFPTKPSQGYFLPLPAFPIWILQKSNTPIYPHLTSIWQCFLCFFIWYMFPIFDDHLSIFEPFGSIWVFLEPVLPCVTPFQQHSFPLSDMTSHIHWRITWDFRWLQACGAPRWPIGGLWRSSATSAKRPTRRRLGWRGSSERRVSAFGPCPRGQVAWKITADNENRLNKGVDNIYIYNFYIYIYYIILYI